MQSVLEPLLEVYTAQAVKYENLWTCTNGRNSECWIMDSIFIIYLWFFSDCYFTCGFFSGHYVACGFFLVIEL